MALLSFLTGSSSKSKHPDAFEKELLQLQLRITNQQNKLDTIKSRLNSSLTTITLYSIGSWLVYSLLWYFRPTPITPLISRLAPSLPASVQPLLALPVILTPFALQSFRWFFQAYYQRQDEKEQIELRLLKKQLRDKVEEIKKKTAYYSTKELLERYDDQIKQENSPPNSLAPNQPGRMGYPPMMVPTPEAILRQRNRVTSSSTVNSNHPADQAESPNDSKFSTAQPLNPQLSVPSPISQRSQNLDPHSSPFSSSGKRGWADRVAEALLGNDEASPESKYALICKNCLVHNGLVRKEELDFIKYICPKCGTLNSRNREPKQTRKEDEEGSEKHHELLKMGGIGATTKGGRYQQLEQHVGAGRKSLCGPVTRNKSSENLFNMLENKRSVSYTNPGASISTSSSTDKIHSVDHSHSDTLLEPSLTDNHDGLEDHINCDSVDHSQNTASAIPHTPSQQPNSRSKSKKKKKN